MASILDEIFGSKVKIPDAKVVDATTEAAKSGRYNRGQLNEFYNYAPGFSDFLSNLFDTQNPNVKTNENSLLDLGKQLMDTGQTKAMGDYFAYSRRIGLETAAATGAPVSSQFAQNLGGGLGVENILRNQLAGAGLVGNVTDTQAKRGQAFLNPAISFLSSNLTQPGQFIQNGQFNVTGQNQNDLLRANAQAQPNPFAKWVTDLTAEVTAAVAGKAGGMAMGGI